MRSMKNASKTARIGIMLLVLCLISTVMLSGTFAKYTSEYAGADTALIAKWEVTPAEGSTGFAVSPATQELDLFSHAYDTNILATAGSQKIIAPGVKGDFVLNIANTGDVAAKMTFDFAVSGNASTAPIEYSLTGLDGSWGNLTTLDTNLEALASMTSVADTTGTATQTVYWRWPYEASSTVYGTSTNETDTDLGAASALAAATGNRTDYILTVKATATQILPTE